MSDFVDTNVFLRFLVRDDLQKTVRSGELLARAERGEIELMTSEAVVLEVVQVLSRLYRMERVTIAQIVPSLFENRGLQLDHKLAISAAFELYGSTKLDYTDCLAIEHARRTGGGAVYSYDRAIGRVPGVRRLEP